MSHGEACNPLWAFCSRTRPLFSVWWQPHVASLVCGSCSACAAIRDSSFWTLRAGPDMRTESEGAWEHMFHAGRVFEVDWTSREVIGSYAWSTCCPVYGLQGRVHLAGSRQARFLPPEIDAYVMHLVIDTLLLCNLHFKKDHTCITKRGEPEPKKWTTFSPNRIYV